jgi:uncharacterized protein YukE
MSDDIIIPDRLYDLAEDLDQFQAALDDLLAKYTRCLSESEEYWNNRKARAFRDLLLDEITKVEAFAAGLESHTLTIRSAADEASQG